MRAWILMLVTVLGCQPTYLERRAGHTTQLTHHGPVLENAPRYPAPEGAKRVTYRSGGLELWGWYQAPAGAGPFPALVVLHGGPHLRPWYWEHTQAFREAGFAVFTPSLRGKNGNPGAHELFYGEVDDARAALGWLAELKEVDAGCIVVFGHSMGGGVAALLTLYPDAPVADTASASGIYRPATFAYWASVEHEKHLVRFDVEDPDETELRVLGPHGDQMVHPHIAYWGDEERAFARNTRALKGARHFERKSVEGDHMSAVRPALHDFLARTRRTCSLPMP